MEYCVCYNLLMSESHWAPGVVCVLMAIRPSSHLQLETVWECHGHVLCCVCVCVRVHTLYVGLAYILCVIFTFFFPPWFAVFRVDF